MDDEHGYALSLAHHNFQPIASLQSVAVSSWHNITAWVFNVTRHAPSLDDIVWAGPRVLTKLGSYLSMPDPAEVHRHLSSSPRNSPQNNPRANIYNILEPNNGLQEVAKLGSLGDQTISPNQATPLSLNGVRGLGSVFNYATSKWAISCIVMAIVLNRTHIFAATRRRLRFRWHTRILLRIIPLVLLVLQSIRLLRSIQCQSSANFSEYRWGNRSAFSELTSAYPNAFLNKLSSTLLLESSDRQSCESVNMVPRVSGGASEELYGSLSILWPLFGMFCLSHFIETLSCAVQGRPLSVETGMTLFEQSLAFAEADATVLNQLDWGMLSGMEKNDKGRGGVNLEASLPSTRPILLNQANAPSEVLFIAFLSSMTHISSHLLGIFDAQSRYRLMNTGFWGICFMGIMIWSAVNFEFGNPVAQGLLRFPTVCIIGFVPHVLVLFGILMCLLIYGLALVLCTLTPSTNLSTSSLRRRLANAHSNMQANMSLAEIRITRNMDFYTALLRTGFAVITIAGEAVYLNEEQNIYMQQRTWLEEARLREADDLRSHVVGIGFSNALCDQIGTIGLIPVKEGTQLGVSGFARERAAQKVLRGQSGRSARAGTGATERSSRWLLALEFLLNIALLTSRAGALSILWILGWTPLRTRPTWLVWLASRQKSSIDDRQSKRKKTGMISQQAVSLFGEQALPHMDDFDVEDEFRRINASQDEDSLDAELYKYWVSGGWWGSHDASGDYIPEESDDLWDTTSDVSVSIDDVEANGTLTIGDDFQSFDRHSTVLRRASSPVPDHGWETDHLARLLHPVTIEERNEAQALSAHLQSEKIMTRSAFRHQEQVRRTRVLLRPWSVRDCVGQPTTSFSSLSLDEEEQLLEQIIMSRRCLQRSESHVHSCIEKELQDNQSLPCVVCHSSPRTIIVWPCRCLSLCDDCRVSLAMNSFDKCVCCRRDVLSFSRVFVP